MGGLWFAFFAFPFSFLLSYIWCDANCSHGKLVDKKEFHMLSWEEKDKKAGLAVFVSPISSNTTLQPIPYQPSIYEYTLWKEPER